MPPGCFALKGETTIAIGNSYTLSVSFADSSPNGGAFPETCRFPAGGILCRPYTEGKLKLMTLPTEAMHLHCNDKFIKK